MAIPQLSDLDFGNTSRIQDLPDPVDVDEPVTLGFLQRAFGLVPPDIVSGTYELPDEDDSLTEDR